MSWQPLCEEQPIAGDPEATRRYGGDLVATADLIQRQAELLRGLADPDNWQAETADAFRDQAGDLEREISKAQDRYREVGGFVQGWARMIDDARSEAERLRIAAVEQQAVLDSTPEGQPEPDPADPASPPQITPAGEQQNVRRQRAQDEIDALRGRLEGLRERHRDEGEEVGRLIRGAQNDDLNDGFWDRVRAWVADHAPLLRDIATWAGRVAAVVGIIALFCTPLGWIAAAAAAIAVLASGALLVSGDGSWGSFLLNVVGLASFGLGAFVARGVPALFRAGRGAQAAVAGSRAQSAVFSAADSAVVALAARLPLIGRGLSSVLRLPQTIARIPSAVRAAMAAERTVLQVPLQSTTFLRRTLFGGSTPAAMRAEAQAWLKVGDTAVAEGLEIVARTNTFFAATVTGGLVNGFLIVEDLWLPELPPNDEWPDLGPVDRW